MQWSFIILGCWQFRAHLGSSVRSPHLELPHWISAIQKYHPFGRQLETSSFQHRGLHRLTPAPQNDSATLNVLYIHLLTYYIRFWASIWVINHSISAALVGISHSAMPTFTNRSLLRCNCKCVYDCFFYFFYIVYCILCVLPFGE